jgi:2-amino-4-hydroxy-6-hydroxymethyldihydropteridine diphosphokinase
VPRIYLGLGSSIDRERHIRAALQALTSLYGTLLISPVYESEAIGFEGDNFLNLVVGVDSDAPLAHIAAQMRAIEDANDRVRSGPKWSARSLDIDILTYGDAVGVVDGVELPRDEVTRHAFVLLPLSDIAGDEICPGTDRSFATLWQQFDADQKREQKLWRVEF